jgi:hypothetical protein
MKMTNKLADALITLNEKLKPFLSTTQRAVLTGMLQGEEGDFFADKVAEIAKQIEDCPVTYATQNQAEPLASLHYFGGSYDAWIVEKDVIGGVEQAYGYASFAGKGQGQFGYISIAELVEEGIELDLYWTPKPVVEFT